MPERQAESCGFIILVTGATGAIGPQVVGALIDAGYSIRVLIRSAGKQCLFPPTVDTVIGDITDYSSVEKAVTGCCAVIHLAALLHIINPSEALASEYKRINVEGTRNVVNASLEAGVRRFIYFSTINVYGNTNGQIVSESTPPAPNNYYAQTKLDAEKIVLDSQSTQYGQIGVVLRLGAVYGSRIKGNYSTLFSSIMKGRFIPIGRGKNRRTLVYDKDVAQATLLALESSVAIGNTYNLTDGEFHTVRQILNAMYLSVGKTSPRVYIPLFPVRMLANILDPMLAVIKFERRSIRSTIDKYTEDIAVDGQCIQNNLGFQPQYTLLKGWQDSVEILNSSRLK